MRVYCETLSDAIRSAYRKSGDIVSCARRRRRAAAIGADRQSANSLALIVCCEINRSLADTLNEILRICGVQVNIVVHTGAHNKWPCCAPPTHTHSFAPDHLH